MAKQTPPPVPPECYGDEDSMENFERKASRRLDLNKLLKEWNEGRFPPKDESQTPPVPPKA